MRKTIPLYLGIWFVTGFSYLLIYESGHVIPALIFRLDPVVVFPGLWTIPESFVMGGFSASHVPLTLAYIGTATENFWVAFGSFFTCSVFLLLLLFSRKNYFLAPALIGSLVFFTDYASGAPQDFVFGAPMPLWVRAFSSFLCLLIFIFALRNTIRVMIRFQTEGSEVPA